MPTPESLSHEREFMPLQSVVDQHFCLELLENKTMPAVIVCVVHDQSGTVYSKRHNDKAVGLPVIDLAKIGSHETPEHYATFRLYRFGLRLPDDVLQLIPVESNISPTIDDIRNPGYEHIHERIYFPVVGRTDILPRGQKLVAVSKEELMQELSPLHDGDAGQQIRDMHQELLFDYAW